MKGNSLEMQDGSADDEVLERDCWMGIDGESLRQMLPSPLNKFGLLGERITQHKQNLAAGRMWANLRESVRLTMSSLHEPPAQEPKLRGVISDH